MRCAKLFSLAWLTVICSSSLADGPKIPEAQQVWSVVLAQNTSGLPNTSSSFAGTRRAVIVGDRVVVIVDVGPLKIEGARTKSTDRLFSLELATGNVKDSRDVEDFRTPDLYATDDDHVIMGEFSLVRLASDLKPTGEQFDEKGHGRTINISPDGSTLAHELSPGTELLNSHTLLTTGVQLGIGVPTAVGTSAYVTDNVHWIGDYPHDKTFVTLVDVSGQHLLYHGACSGRPSFLSDTKVVVTGCGKVTVISTSGNGIKEALLRDKDAAFAGVSRDGRRVALRSVERSFGDPWSVRSEWFTIYDTETLQPVALVKSRRTPDEASWSAFSKDGKMFVSGSPQMLTLYKIP